MKYTDNISTADLLILPGFAEEGFSSISLTRIIYAVAVPFFTVQDELEFNELIRLWEGQPGEGANKTLIVSDETASALSLIWGKASSSVLVRQDNELDLLLEERTQAIAIIPFEHITPRMKILKLSGLSPLDKPLDEEKYPLVMDFTLAVRDGADDYVIEKANQLSKLLPKTNRDESRMTVIIMSGTTALTRAVAAKIQLKGVDYPVELVKDWFLNADLRHVSNEAPFVEGCPEPDPFTTSLQFCSDPSNIAVLENLGVNVVELTGNHVNDYGPENFAATVEMYQDRDWVTYGGGLDPASASEPGLVESNGNKIAFLGCNRVGPTQAWVEEWYPGAAKCDFDQLYPQISDLKSKGFVVIVSFQHQEVYKYMYEFSSERSYRRDFQRAIEAGADIVQGSQAHYPMGFELMDNGFIHYGLGNFLFDQMDVPVKGTRREFIDRHIVYDGKYMNTEVLTALLQDYSRPEPMNDEDRVRFLSDIFSASER